MHYLYGVDLNPETPPLQVMELLAEARALGISSIDGNKLAHLVTERLTTQNCVDILLHEELVYQPLIADAVCSYVAEYFFVLIQDKNIREQMLQVNKNFVIVLFRDVALRCQNPSQAAEAVKFAVEWSNLDTACDLLKDCKVWPWNDGEGGMSYFVPAPVSPDQPIDDSLASTEWSITQVNRMLRDQLPLRIVRGHGFNWSVRLDHGAEGKIRIVYEAAAETERAVHSCIKRFPAAMFAWQVIYKGNNVFCERPVFICFPQGVSLHWSTTLPITAAELKDDDEIIIRVSMAENPLVSLILYHFSSDLGATMTREDILNRLPHIEYRCLSSYSLYQQAKEQIAATAAASAHSRNY